VSQCLSFLPQRQRETKFHADSSDLRPQPSLVHEFHQTFVEFEASIEWTHHWHENQVSFPLFSSKPWFSCPISYVCLVVFPCLATFWNEALFQCLYSGLARKCKFCGYAALCRYASCFYSSHVSSSRIHQGSSYWSHWKSIQVTTTTVGEFG
jgi:hypothetical protein